MTIDRMIARLIPPAFLVAAVLLPWSAMATDAASVRVPVQRGEALAQERCSACHIVAEKQEYPSLLRYPAPSFRSIANRPETSAKTLRLFVSTTHWDLKAVPITMPNPELSYTERTAVISYILSLKGP